MTSQANRSESSVIANGSDRQLLDLLWTELIQLGSESSWRLTRQQRARKLEWAQQLVRELRRRSSQLRLV